MSELELNLFIKIFKQGSNKDLVSKLFEELSDVDSISALEGFVESCLVEEKNVDGFRDCVIRKIKSEKNQKNKIVLNSISSVMDLKRRRNR
ncbi:hypothetical protein [Lacimicrobium alkaliphilum]|uniref:Uncharacterized protein n=1 Tax=Lacimicrobium alkaliphilum TaxID=1526571 RepID=A0A0U3B2I5_9ALTE|nr:hypothetical protein [Lacimicrobium alkaliphilum]ALS97785.1 hypothetical protein AT746_05515 [Lacimicrobium alkaliphilum]